MSGRASGDCERWATGYCDHTSSMYLVWEMTSQFWGLWWHFLMQWVLPVKLLFLMMFLYISMVRSSYIIILSGMGNPYPFISPQSERSKLGDFLFVLLIISEWSSSHVVIWSYDHLIIWSSGHLVNMVILSFCHLIIWPIWSSSQYGHLVNMLIW